MNSKPEKPKTDSVVSTDFLLTTLQQQMETNSKLVKIVINLTHRLEQATAIIEGLNHTIIEQNGRIEPDVGVNRALQKLYLKEDTT